MFMNSGAGYTRASRSSKAEHTIHIRHINISLRASEARRRLSNLLKRYGELERVKMGPKGQAFAQFKDKRSAAAAADVLNGLYYLGTFLYAEPAFAEMEGKEPRAERAIATRLLIVENLDEGRVLLGQLGPGLVFNVREVPSRDILLIDFRTVLACTEFYRRALELTQNKGLICRVRPGVMRLRSDCSMRVYRDRSRRDDTTQMSIGRGCPGGKYRFDL